MFSLRCLLIVVLCKRSGGNAGSQEGYPTTESKGSPARWGSQGGSERLTHTPSNRKLKKSLVASAGVVATPGTSKNTKGLQTRAIWVRFVWARATFWVRFSFDREIEKTTRKT